MDYNDQNEKAMPLCCLSIALLVIGVISIVSGSYILAFLLFAVGLMLVLITWALYPKSGFARTVAITCIVILILLAAWTVISFAKFFHDLSNCSGLS